MAGELLNRGQLQALLQQGERQQQVAQHEELENRRTAALANATMFAAMLPDDHADLEAMGEALDKAFIATQNVLARWGFNFAVVKPERED